MFWTNTSRIILNTSLEVFLSVGPKHGLFRARYRPSAAVVRSSPTDCANGRPIWITGVCSELYNVFEGKEAPCFGPTCPVPS